MQKIKKFWRLVPEIFWKNLIFRPKLGYLPRLPKNKSFRAGTTYVNFKLLLCPKFMQKIKKILGGYLKIFLKKPDF